MKTLYYVLTIVLTGEALSGWLANNAGVLLMIIGVLVFWYLVSRDGEPGCSAEIETQSSTETDQLS